MDVYTEVWQQLMAYDLPAACPGVTEFCSTPTPVSCWTHSSSPGVTPASHTQPEPMEHLKQPAPNPVYSNQEWNFPSECHQSAVPVNTCPSMTFQVSYKVHAASLQTRFLYAGLTVNDTKELEQLQSFYQHQSYQIDAERNQSLQSTQTTPWMFENINTYYDHLQHQLVNRTENSLNLLLSYRWSQQSQSQSLPKCLPQRAPVCKTRYLNPTAIKVMTLWYKRNKEHPYLTHDNAEVMAKAGGITTEQVKKWFSNKRKRSGNIKTVREVTARWRCPSPCSTQMFLFAETRHSQE